MDELGLTAVRTTQSFAFSAALKGSGANLTVKGWNSFPEEAPALVAAATALSLKCIAVVACTRRLAARIYRSHPGM